jgi:hypothetical protein
VDDITGFEMLKLLDKKTNELGAALRIADADLDLDSDSESGSESIDFGEEESMSEFESDGIEDSSNHEQAVEDEEMTDIES